MILVHIKCELGISQIHGATKCENLTCNSFPSGISFYLCWLGFPQIPFSGSLCRRTADFFTRKLYLCMPCLKIKVIKTVNNAIQFPSFRKTPLLDSAHLRLLPSAFKWRLLVLYPEFTVVFSRRCQSIGP